jgi:DNA helicase-2/ATP-dependent DNA helicase PcrA
MEEERRLAYVAITRAKKRLCLTCARQRMLFGRTTANRVSRFVSEIPEEHIKKNIPKGYGFRDKSYEQTVAEREYRQPKFSFNAPAPTPQKRTISAATAPTSQALPAFALGDNVNHKAFGSGVITKLTAMGGDYLVEINFEKIGTKKLMLRAAAQYMSKE